MRKQRRMNPRVKTWKLKQTQAKEEFQRLVAESLRASTTSDWKNFQTSILNAADQACFKICTKRQHKRETWWWCDSVQDDIMKKKRAFKIWQKSGLDTVKTICRDLNHAAKRAVAEARSQQCRQFIEAGKSEQLKSLYQLAKQSA